MRRVGAGRLTGGLIAAVLAAGLAGCGSATPSVAVSAEASSAPSASGAATPSPTEGGTPTDAPTIAPTPAVTPSGPFTLTSDAFVDGGSIPRANSCDGADTSPPLSWTGAPAGTATFALIVDDPDAGGFIHWVLFDLDGAATALGAAIPAQADGNPPQGRNSFGKVGYGGPCPPSGTHHYRFRLLALATRLSLSGGPTAGQVLAGTSGHILGEAMLTGTYRRH